MFTNNTRYNYKKFNIDPKNYSSIKKINSGGFGSVYEVQNKSTNEKLAAKIIKLDIEDPKCRQMANREILIMIRCQHPTIINFIGYSFRDIFGQQNITIFMELAKNGSLADLLKNVKNGLAPTNYDNTMRQIILIGIARGMMHLHQQHVIHCDLKPGNVLLDSNYHPHLTDFGLSKIYERNSTMSASNQVGTYTYMAPELIIDNKHNGKIDVYSFGILMYEVITDLVPYPSFEEKKLTLYKFNNLVANEGERPQFTKNVPVKKSLKNLIERCWSKDPKERPTFEELFKKLAYNIEDSIFDIYEDQRPIDNKGEEEEEEEHDDNKYYLDGVDVEEIISYADSINYEDNSSELDNVLKKLKTLEDTITPLMKENEKMKKKISNIIEDEIKPLKKDNSRLKNENKEIKAKLDNIIENDIQQLKKENSRLRKENAKIQKQFDDILHESHDHEKAKEIAPSKKTANVNIDKITIKEFNSLELQAQQNCVSQIKSKIKNSKTKDFFYNIDNFLLLLLKFIQTNSLSFFKISKDDDYDYNNNDDDIEEDVDEILLKEINENYYIHILSNATDLLYVNRSLHLPEFTNLLKQFKNVSIEMIYPSVHFDASYNIISTIKISQAINIDIFITNIGKIDLYFQKKKIINHICVDVSVASIEANAFEECSSLKQISIPPSVSLIGSNSFLHCTSLKQIIIPCSVLVIKEGTFKECSSLFKVKIPNSVTTIESYSFYGCSSLEEIKIPSSVKTIGNNVFDGCSSLTKVAILSSIKCIGDNVFNGCTSLQKISIPSSVETIGNNAFNGCSSLTKITIPDSVEKIGNGAFCDCSSLKAITIPSSVNSFGKNCFKGIKSLQILGSIEQIPDNLFIGCLSLKEIKIPSSVVIIGNNSFNGCKSLTKITIPDSVEKIGNNAFNGCSLLKELSIPSSVETIGSNAFNGCSLLKEITFPSSIKSFGKSCFNGITSLKILGTIQNIPNYLFSECSSLKEITIPSSVERIGNGAFNECSLLKKVAIPSSVETIGTNAFNGCSSLKEIIIPSSIGIIGSGVFNGCSSLTTITIPSSVKSFGENCFTGITSLQILGNIECIPDNLFNRCSSLKEIIIPSSVNLIGKQCFNDCKNLSKVTIESLSTRINSNSFQNCPSLSLFKISTITIGNSSYQGESIFSYCNIDQKTFNSYCGEIQTLIFQFISIMNKNRNKKDLMSSKISDLLIYLSNKLNGFDKLASNINFIFIHAEFNCDDFIVLNSKIVEILFANNIFNLNELIIDSEYFGLEIEYPSKDFEDVFQKIVQYKKEQHNSFNIVVLFTCCPSKNNRPKRLESINCVKFDSTVTSIEEAALGGYTSLTRVIIPWSVTKIGKDAFYGCGILKYASISSPEIDIHSEAFWGCNSLKCVSLPLALHSKVQGFFPQNTHFVTF